MKKIVLFVLLCLPFVQLKAQDGIMFKVKFLPNHTYQSTGTFDMNMHALLSGDSSLLDKLKTEDITSPVDAKVNLSMNGNMKTGSVGADKSFPLAMNYQITNFSALANGKQLPIPAKVKQNIKIAGHVSPDGNMVIDSAQGKVANDSTKRKIQQMINLFEKEVVFPDKPLKPGDTFTQGGPIDVTLAGENKIHADATVIYKLVSVSNGKAYFDLTPNVNVNFNIMGLSVSITSTGTGKMVYSIADNYPISKQATVNLKIKVTSDKLNVDATGVASSSYTGTIN